MFAKDLLVDPETRHVSDVQHCITAVASSSSQQRAQDFIVKIGASQEQQRYTNGAEVKAYGSYEELVADENVDIIYIATPHSHHYQNALLCLRAGKNVCCEVSRSTPFLLFINQTFSN
jgi:dihydrodiol dehydrogenase / D-xylose 1-dehydrogenase (NADP)